jgi:hypothetical protein
LEDAVGKTHFDPRNPWQQAESKVLLDLADNQRLLIRPNAPEVIFVLTMHLRGATPLRESIITQIQRFCLGQTRILDKS